MAGHSKWANIKHRKARQDAKRAKIWSKVIREITVAAKLHGASIEANPRLRLAVEGALNVNMPRDTINRAIDRGSGAGNEGELDEVVYEGYGPGGVALLVEAMTDNRNRTVAEVRHAFSRHNCNLAKNGSVSYLFKKQGVIQILPPADEDLLMAISLDSGAEDMDTDEEGVTTITTQVDDFANVMTKLREHEISPELAEITKVASRNVACDEDMTGTVQNLIESLEDLDDVQNVYSNAEFSFPDASQ